MRVFTHEPRRRGCWAAFCAGRRQHTCTRCMSHSTALASVALPQARQRLELRLREKDAQLGKLRGVVRELEGKLIEAHKRQADL